MSVSDREVVLSAPADETLIKDSQWLIMNARGLPTEAEARLFGHNLRAALEVSSVSTRLGVDVGRDLPTSGVSREVAEGVKARTGTILRDNVHGLDVFEDDPNVVFFDWSMTAKNLASPDAFLSCASKLFAGAAALPNDTQDVVLLLNYALMRPEPVAQIVFAFSAVEMLGQREAWTDAQRELLSELAASARRSSLGCDDERQEVSDAITKSLHRLSLRQGALRLLDRLKLSHLKPQWDKLYAERSTLVHGLAPRPGADYGELAFRSVSLCGHILLRAVAADLPVADQYAATYYEVKV